MRVNEAIVELSFNEDYTVRVWYDTGAIVAEWDEVSRIRTRLLVALWEERILEGFSSIGEYLLGIPEVNAVEVKMFESGVVLYKEWP